MRPYFTTSWDEKGIELLDKSLSNISQESNNLDWKQDIAPNHDKIKKHLIAFANYPGGGYLIFGIDDKNGNVLGYNDKSEVDYVTTLLTNFCRDSFNVGLTIQHAVKEFRGKEILLVHIAESSTKPVYENKKNITDTYIRVGGTTRKATEKDLQSLLLNSKPHRYENLRCTTLINVSNIKDHIDIEKFYILLGEKIPNNYSEIFSKLDKEGLVELIDEGAYITTLGAITAAYNLSKYDKLLSKNIRFVKYQTKNKTKPESEATKDGQKGYAVGFEGLIQYLRKFLPQHEIIVDGIRKTEFIIPEEALREIIANALIHQDFNISGSGPMIEYFSDRIEITNPGALLPTQKIDRLIRAIPQSRNEKLSYLFRRLGICELRGSGIEKAIHLMESKQLPPLKFEQSESSFKVIMYLPKSFSDYTLDEKIEACYQHCTLQYYNSGDMSNESLRLRFGLKKTQYSQISKLIDKAIRKKKIKVKDETISSTKYIRYIPYWA